MRKPFIYLSIFCLSSCGIFQNEDQLHTKNNTYCKACINTPAISKSEGTSQQTERNYKHPFLGSNKTLLMIINSALEHNRQVSSLSSVVEQRKAEADVVRLNNWPTVQPAARYSNQTSPYIGINANYTLYDFGLASQKEKESQLNITSSDIDRVLEERAVVATTLEMLAKLASLIQNEKLLQDAIKDIQHLVDLAEIRLKAGLSSLSESNTLTLRLSELQSELDSIQININLNLELLSSKLISPIILPEVPTLEDISKEILTNLGDDSLQLKQAEINKSIAEAQLEQVKSQVYPHLGVEVETGKATNGRSTHAIGLVMQIPTSIFSSSASVHAAESTYNAKERILIYTQQQLALENKRILLETNRLIANRKALEKLEKSGAEAVSIFNTEFEANSSSLSDGLSAYRTLLQTRQQLVNSQMELINLQASKIKITNGSIFK